MIRSRANDGVRLRSRVRALHLVTCLALVVPSGVGAQAAPTPQPSWAHLDTRFFHADSDDAVRGFGLDLMQVGPRVAGLWLPEAGATDRGALLWNGPRWQALRRDLLSFTVSIFLGTAYGHAVHEYGHATRLAASGFDPLMAHRSYAGSDEIVAAVRAGEGTNDFFAYFLTSLFDRSGSTVATVDRLRRPVDLSTWSERWSGAAVMGGLNAEMAFSLVLGEAMQDGRGHAGMMSTYLNGKLSARHYGTGPGVLNDMSNVLSFYAEHGIEVDHAAIRAGSARSALLSAGTYRLAWALGSMLTGRGARTPSTTLGPLLLPETGFHLGPSGISHSLQSGVRIRAWAARVTYEWVLEGIAQREVTLGLAGRRGRVSGDLRVRRGEGFGGEIGLDWRLSERLEVGGVLARYDPDNLFGARHTTRIEGDRVDHVGAVRLGWRW